MRTPTIANVSLMPAVVFAAFTIACSSGGSAANTSSAQASSAARASAACDSLGGPTSTPYFEFQVERQPAITKHPVLNVPGIRGKVTAQYIINADGRPDSTTIKIIRSDSSVLSDSARALIPSLRYQPGRIGECAVRVLLQQIIEAR